MFYEGKWEELIELNIDHFAFHFDMMEFSSLCHMNVRRISAAMGVWTLFMLLVLRNYIVYSNSDYLVGLGSYDITGPAADVNMMGYANTEQIASGIHFRLRARTFIVAEPKGNRVVFVNLDACMASQLVTIKVFEKLKARYQLWLVLISDYCDSLLELWYFDHKRNFI